MKKVEVISRNQKDKEKLVSSLELTAPERIINMLRLMELSFYLRSDKEIVSDNANNPNIIELKLVNGTE